MTDTAVEEEFTTVNVPIQPKGIYAKATDRHMNIHFLDPYSCSCFRLPPGGDPANYVARGFTPLEVKTREVKITQADGSTKILYEPIIPDDNALIPALKKRLPALKESLDPSRYLRITDALARREDAIKAEKSEAKKAAKE